MVKPHTAPHRRKPHTFPEHNFATLTEREQRKFIGKPNEHLLNLGHPTTEDRLMEHPLQKTLNYDTAPTEKTFADPPRLQGVYRKCDDPKSGISAQQNIDAWAERASANSYDGHHHKAGPGVHPTMPDPRGRHSNESDGYLESTKRWPDFNRAGSESGGGRLDKLHKR
jgi:hypothetical protein